MHPLFTEKYFPQYLNLCIGIFHKPYLNGSNYKNNPLWIEYLNLLKDSGVNRVIICKGRMVGDISQEYFATPMTKNTPSEEFLKERYVIAEVLEL